MEPRSQPPFVTRRTVIITNPIFCDSRCVFSSHLFVRGTHIKFLLSTFSRSHMGSDNLHKSKLNRKDRVFSLGCRHNSAGQPRTPAIKSPIAFLPPRLCFPPFSNTQQSARFKPPAPQEYPTLRCLGRVVSPDLQCDRQRTMGWTRWALGVRRPSTTRMRTIGLTVWMTCPTFRGFSRRLLKRARPANISRRPRPARRWPPARSSRVSWAGRGIRMFTPRKWTTGSKGTQGFRRPRCWPGADAVIERVLGKNSELRESWQEGDDAEWLDAVADLRRRLRV